MNAHGIFSGSYLVCRLPACYNTNERQRLDILTTGMQRRDWHVDGDSHGQAAFRRRSHTG